MSLKILPYELLQSLQCQPRICVGLPPSSRLLLPASRIAVIAIVFLSAGKPLLSSSSSVTPPFWKMEIAHRRMLTDITSRIAGNLSHLCSPYRVCRLFLASLDQRVRDPLRPPSCPIQIESHQRSQWYVRPSRPLGIVVRILRALTRSDGLTIK